MAKKSKTQRAKASAVRAAKKEHAQQEETPEDKAAQAAEAEAAASAKPKLGFLKKVDKEAESIEKKQTAKKEEKKEDKKADKKPEKKVKKQGFLSLVRAELKRVTWPTKQDVLRWSGVVLAALLFFGIFVAVLDNFVVTPVLVGISSLGA